jgi:hypothetical protein
VVSASIQADPADLHKFSDEVKFTLQSIEKPELKVVDEGVFIGPKR